jgi:DnaJ-class molecular chaperone
MQDRAPIRPVEQVCSGCNGTGFQPVVQPNRPGIRIYPARCKECLGKGRTATHEATRVGPAYFATYDEL